MEKLIYTPKTREIDLDIHGRLIRLNPVIKTLDDVAKSIIKEHSSNTQIIQHNEYTEVCSYDLWGWASNASKIFSRTIGSNPELTEFASSEISLGNISVLSLNSEIYNEQILNGLDDNGKTWQYTNDKREAEELIKRVGIPLIIPLNHFSEIKKRKMMSSIYRIIDRNTMIKKALDEYDSAMLSENHLLKEKYKSMSLDDISLGIGYNLYQKGLSPIKFYTD